MKKFVFLLVVSLTVLFSCKKKEFPQSIKEDPVFYMKAEIDGEQVEWKAGENEYYMYSGFYQDTNNLYHFSAELKKKVCSSASCPNSVVIEISDDKPSVPQGTSNIALSINPGTYNYEPPVVVTPSVVGYAVTFRSEVKNSSPQGYSWNFGDGHYSDKAHPTHTFMVGGVYNTCVSVTDASGVHTLCNKIKVTTNPGVCQTIILIAGVNYNTIMFSQYSLGTPPFSYKWNFGDGNYSTDANPLHTYSLDGLYLVNLKVKDANNDSASFNYYINTQFSEKAAPNFSVTAVDPVYQQVLHSIFSKVQVRYTDANGMVYSSRLMNQPNESEFVIESVNDYETNSKGQKTKKLKVKFNCTVYNGNLSKKIKNAEAIIAVAYK